MLSEFGIAWLGLIHRTNIAYEIDRNAKRKSVIPTTAHYTANIDDEPG
jgi:hypothetical protein